MARVKNPLPDVTDAEILLKCARVWDYSAEKRIGPARRVRRAIAARLRQMARRVPL